MTETVADRSMDRPVAEMIDAGVFGPGSEFVSFEPDSQHTGQDQYASTVYFGTVAVRDREDNQHSHQLVFKLKPQESGLRDLYLSDWQFHNEIVFYEQIIPFFQTCVPTDRMPTLARYFYGRNNCSDLVLDDMIVLENASPRGYRLSKERLFLDRDHMIVALRTLAKFHGLSYRAKHKDPVRFFEIITHVKETQLRNGDDWVLPDGGRIISKLLSVVLDRLAQRGDVSDDDSRVHRFKTKFMGDMKQTLLRVMRNHQPLAILCHGDFNRNNLLFQYNDAGQPVDALAFDLATLRYGSPALDLSFFLYMNTDRGLRDKHWDELLDAYCAALAAAVSDVTDVIRVPDRSELDAEMRECSIYGLTHVAFFMRVMMEENIFVDPSAFIEAGSEKVYEALQSFGGDKATDLIADAVLHYLDTNGSRTE